MSRRKTVRWIFFFLYNGLLLTSACLWLPVLMYGVATKAKRRRTLGPRMGWCRYPWEMNRPLATIHPIWVHALSVGEVRAAQPLVNRLNQLYPDSRICLSASTLAGFQVADRIFGRHARIDLAYFPYDLIWAVRRVTNLINPSMVILIETDLWPNFLMEMRRRSIPVYLVNLRWSDRSWKNFTRFKFVTARLLQFLERIGVQGKKDFDRLVSLGVAPDKLAITGNIKFDSALPGGDAELADSWQRRLRITGRRPVIIAGSTHPGEEILLLKALNVLSRQTAPPIMILAPRDPLRSHEILELCRSQGVVGRPLSLMASGETGRNGFPDVVVVDSIGVLKMLYQVADVVFIGGSLVPCGGHNPLEAAAWGKPVLFGPDMRDFFQIAGMLVRARGAIQVTTLDDLLHIVKKLLSTPELARRMGQCALAVLKSNQGAVERTLTFMGLIPTHQPLPINDGPPC